MNKTIFFPRQIAQEGFDYLTDRGFKIKNASAIDEDTLAREVVGCDAVVLRTAYLTEKILRAEPKLKLISRIGIGLDTIDMETVRELGIQVTNTPQGSVISVAEHAMAGILIMARKINELAAATRRGDYFYKNHCQGVELQNKTLGLVGFGDIGQAVARMASQGFGVNILVYKGRMEGKEIPSYVKLVEWDELFQQADIISLHIPMRPENEGIVGAHELALMKPDAFIVNTARGGLINEAALVDAIKQKLIAGAFLDVLEEEPALPDNPLFKFDNVVITPHCAGGTKEGLIRSSLTAAEDIVRFFEGKEPIYPV